MTPVEQARKEAHEAVETPLDWVHVRGCECFSHPADPPFNVQEGCRELTDQIHASIDHLCKLERLEALEEVDKRIDTDLSFMDGDDTLKLAIDEARREVEGSDE